MPGFVPKVIAAADKHEVTLDGTRLGSVRVLPLTVMPQYHVRELGAWKPYVDPGVA